jgi:hypothetical protein
MKAFWGKDFGIIALAKNYPASKVMIKISRDFPEKEIIQESDFWLPLIKMIVDEKTKFGRVGIFYDRKNKEAKSFCKELAKRNFNYQQKNPRAEKSAKFSFLEMQVLGEIANEGLADSVEFRRLARKFIRNAKHLHLDSLVFLEGIFAEKKTRQILAKIAGTQIKTYFVTDFVYNGFKFSASQSKSTSKSKLNDFKNSAKKIFLIETDDDLEFTKKRAEQIIQRKLKSCDVRQVE